MGCEFGPQDGAGRGCQGGDLGPQQCSPRPAAAHGPCPHIQGFSADSDALAFQVVTCPGVTLQGNRAWGPWWPLPQCGTRRWRSLPGTRPAVAPLRGPTRGDAPVPGGTPSRALKPFLSGTHASAQKQPPRGSPGHRGPGLRGDRNDAAVRAARLGVTAGGGRGTPPNGLSGRREPGGGFCRGRGHGQSWASWVSVFF